MTDEHVPVRLSHLLRDCSVGAIVRGPDSLMVVQDIRTWDRRGRDPLEREIRYVDRVRSALGIGELLCTPPRSAERDGTLIGWIPALRFPTWMRCLKCGLMHLHPGEDSGRSTVAAGTLNPEALAEPRKPENASSAAAGWSRRPGFSFTKTAIWRTSRGTLWPTGIVVTRSSVNATLTGRSRI